MKKILTKTNISLLIITLCTILFCGLFAISNITTKKVPTAHAESSAMLKGATTSDIQYIAGNIWWTLLDYDIENLIITNTFDPSTATGDPVDVSEEQNGSLYAYKVDNGNGTYDCVIYADVSVIYAPANSKRLFSGYTGSSSDGATILRNVKSITFENNCFDTSKATSMKAMFGDCQQITSLDVSNFNTINVTNMDAMFVGCYNLQNIDLSKFDTSKVESMSEMFKGCVKLTELDLSNFDTSLVKSFVMMFSLCYSLEEVNISPKLLPTGVYSWNTEKVETMAYMFAGCKELKTMDMHHFTTSLITDSDYGLSLIFGGCTKLESVDISGFDVSNISGDSEVALFGLDDELLITMMNATPPEGQTFDEYLDSQEGPETSPVYAGQIRMMRPCVSIKELRAPNTIGEKTLPLPIAEQLFVNGEESQPLAKQVYFGYEFYCITNFHENTTIQVLNLDTDTPATGFVDEQLLPALAVGFVSIMAVAIVISSNKKRKYN